MGITHMSNTENGFEDLLIDAWRVVDDIRLLVAAIDAGIIDNASDVLAGVATMADIRFHTLYDMHEDLHGRTRPVEDDDEECEDDNEECEDYEYVDGEPVCPDDGPDLENEPPQHIPFTPTVINPYNHDLFGYDGINILDIERHNNLMGNLNFGPRFAGDGAVNISIGEGYVAESTDGWWGLKGNN